MGTVTKHNLYILTKRRDYLQNKIEEKRGKNMPAGYEESEIEALNKVITLAAEFISKEPDGNENNRILNKPPAVEDFTAAKGHPVERKILKEFIRSPKLKLVIARERRGDREYISFQNFHLNEQQTGWQAAPKASIYLSELNDVISVLTNNQITKDELVP